MWCTRLQLALTVQTQFIETFTTFKYVVLVRENCAILISAILYTLALFDSLSVIRFYKLKIKIELISW